MTPRRRSTGGKAHRFGGDWTTAKLEVLRKYLQAYTTALKDKPSKMSPFRKAYIDAFAGTGYRDVHRDDADDEFNSSMPSLFPAPIEKESQDLLDGSARLALQVEPRFDKYIFIEQNRDRCSQLEELKSEFPALSDDIQVREGDANSEIQSLCTMNWSSHRAVLFLDPYGLQVEWKTIEAVASTKAIDMWLLFPLGIGVNRLLTRSGDIPESWRKRLNILLGNEDWYDEFYKVETAPSLFGGHQEWVIKATMETIAEYFVKRLKEVFEGVVEQPGVLRNSANNPLYLFCFAAGNPKGARTALRIADYLLKGLR
jgi:three-Cys-motif partner protein